MIFNTAWFVAFFVLFYAGLWLVLGARLRFLYVLAASAVFHYHFAGPAGVLPIVVMAVLTYAFGLALARMPDGTPRKRLVFAAGIAVPVAGLVFYKYRALVLGSLGLLAPPASGSPTPLILPLAISFFTFEFVHYLTDVSHGSPPVASPLDFAFFSIFFPSIVSGPIKRFQPFLAQVKDGLARPTAALALSGAAQVLIGFFKKLVVADNAALAISAIEAHPEPTRASVAALLLLLSIRILFDFSGYSDIAIGLGKMVGIEQPPNFRFPYIAANISQFWRRWHISLSSWIRDYLYIPLGGGRRGLGKKALNLTVTMFLCGLWHGPAWHFGLWGVYHGFGLAVHGVFERSALGIRFRALRGSRLLGIAATDLFVAYGWLLFFYPVDRVLGYTKVLLHTGRP